VLHDEELADVSLEDGYEIMELSICPKCKGTGLMIKKKGKDE
jgi:hypothetical protein